MIFAHSSDKSKCNLGELSDLPDSSKTPFENIAKVQANKTWTLGASSTGLNTAWFFILDTKATEIMIEAEVTIDNATEMISIILPTEKIMHIGKMHYARLGTPGFYCIYQVTTNGRSLYVKVDSFTHVSATVNALSTNVYYKA